MDILNLKPVPIAGGRALGNLYSWRNTLVIWRAMGITVVAVASNPVNIGIAVPNPWRSQGIGIQSLATPIMLSR